MKSRLLWVSITLKWLIQSRKCNQQLSCYACLSAILQLALQEHIKFRVISDGGSCLKVSEFFIVYEVYTCTCGDLHLCFLLWCMHVFCCDYQHICVIQGWKTYHAGITIYENCLPLFNGCKWWTLLTFKIMMMPVMWKLLSILQKLDNLELCGLIAGETSCVAYRTIDGVKWYIILYLTCWQKYKYYLLCLS